jgi:hypothetical protein
VFQLSLKFQFAAQRFECLKQIVRVVIPSLAIFALGFADDLLKLSGNVRDLIREWRWLFLENRRHHLSWGVAGEWRLPRYHFVKDHAEAPDIGAFINWRAGCLFW